MTKYEVIMHGKLPMWPKDWAVGKEMMLINCVFGHIDYQKDNNVSVATVVEASDENQAEEIGRQECLAECNLFSLCYNYPIQLDLIHIQVDELPHFQRSFFSMGSIWAVDESTMMTSRELEDSLSLVKQAIAGKSVEDLDILRRSIRWTILSRPTRSVPATSPGLKPVNGSLKKGSLSYWPPAPQISVMCSGQFMPSLPSTLNWS